MNHLEYLEHVAIWGPMVAAILTGSAIGLERELATKSAGIRTHALVCFSCALLMMIGLRQDEWLFDPIEGTQVVSDPARMAHGILTGIGFLGAGVIFRQGNAVQGLTTAASIWMTSSLGLLYGAGLWELAVSGTVLTLVVLVVFRAFHFLVPRKLKAAVEVKLGPGADSPDELKAAFERACLAVDPFAVRRSADGQLAVATTVWLKKGDAGGELSEALNRTDAVVEYEITPIRVGEQVNWR